MKKKKINVLVVEDDPNLGIILSEYLEAKGYDTRLCVNGQEGFEAFTKGNFDFCILDIMMPVKDGFTLAKEIRKLDKHIPVIFLTAKSMKEDTLEGFRMGADDYITKPFSMEELLVRMEAVWRRTNKAAGLKSKDMIFKVGKYKFDYKQQLLINNGDKQELTTKETELLKLLCINADEVMERTYMLKAVWEDDSYYNSRSMDVYIAKLRKRLKKDPSVEIINVHGLGFKLRLNPE